MSNEKLKDCLGDRNVRFLTQSSKRKIYLSTQGQKERSLSTNYTNYTKKKKMLNTELHRVLKREERRALATE